MNHVAIRRAQLSDVQALSALAVKTFVDTFGHLYPPEDLKFFLEDTQSVARYTEVLNDPDVAVFLADVDDQPTVGFVSAGRCKLPVPDMSPRAGEIRQLYVLRQFQNHRLGARLMLAALAWLEERGFEPLYIGVWSQNLGAQRFYERYGFRKCGEYEFPVGKTRDHEFILERRSA